ncbi:unnamed protein product, partial [Medioppia subpectinata]
MANNVNLLSELLDIKRQNIDWEIKLENNIHFNTNAKASQHIQPLNSPQNGHHFLPAVTFNRNNNSHTSLLRHHNNRRNNTSHRPKESTPSQPQPQQPQTIHNNNTNESPNAADNRTVSLAANELSFNEWLSSGATHMNHTYDGIRNVEEFVERRKINGITWYHCKWPQCPYASNKSNHLVRHIRKHTGERPFSCNWPNCDKKFTDSWKQKDHILTHKRKLMSIPANTLIGNKSDGNLKQFVEMLNTNTNICEPIDCESELKAKQQLEDNNGRDGEMNSDLNMFVPEVIVSEMDLSGDNVPNVCREEAFVGRCVTASGKEWFRCKAVNCNYGTPKSLYLIRHIRSVHGQGVTERQFGCEWPDCSKRFTDAYKLKEHQLTHYRKFITTVGNN